MAKYGPISPAAIVPGVASTAGPWQALVDNARILYADSSHLGYGPTIAAGNVVASDDTVHEVTGTSYEEVCRVMIPRNADNQPLLVSALMNTDSGDRANLRVVYGGTTATAATTATSYAGVQVACTPTGSGHPREAVVSIAGDAAGDVARIKAISFSIYANTAASSGTMTSGVTEADATLYTANQPISTERVARLMNAASFIAKDRPAGVFSWIEGLSFTGTRSDATADSATPVMVTRANLVLVQSQVRSYRVSMYLAVDGSGSPVPKCVVSLGGQTVTGTAAGWTHGTVTLGGASGVQLEAAISRTSGSNRVYLKTLQVMRET